MSARRARKNNIGIFYMKNLWKLKEEVAYFAFYLGVIIEIILVIIDKSAYTNPIEGIIFRVTFLLFFVKVCLTKYSFKEYLVIIFLLLIGVISYFTTGRNELIRIIMFIAACKDVDMTKCLKMVFWITLAGCICIVMLSLLGIVGTISLTQDYGRGNIETRYVLGMGHPNALQCMVVVLTILGLYIYHANWKWFSYVGIWLINAFFFMLTDSKSALLVASCAILLFFCVSKIENSKVEKLFIAGNISIIAGSIIISLMIAKNAMCLWHYYWEGATSVKINFYLFLDKLLTGRIHSLIETNNHEGIMDTWSLFSRPENNYYFDMGWIRLFYWYGIIPAIFTLLILAGVVWYFAKKRKLDELVFFAMFSLYTISEAHIISVYIARNYLLFIVGMYWYRLLGNQKNRKILKDMI